METNKSLKIQRTLLPEPNQRAYHSHAKLVHSPIQAESGMPEAHQNGILEALLEIPGVEAAALKPYTVLVLKSPAWNWDSVEPGIITLIGCLNFEDGKAVEQIDGKVVEGEQGE